MVDTNTRCGRTAFAATLLAMAIGLAVLAGWFFGLEFLKRVVPGLNPVNPAVAVGIVLAGAALALLLRPLPKSIATPWPARIGALNVLLIGGAELFGPWFGWRTNIDRWLFAGQMGRSSSFTGLMAPITAVNLVLIGGALLAGEAKHRALRLFAEVAGGVVVLQSLLTLLGYVYDLHAFSETGPYISMALPTALAMLFLGFALLLAHTDRGLMAVFAAEGPGGRLAVRLLPAAVLVPSAMGWLIRRAEAMGFFGDTFSDAAFAVSNMLAFSLMVGWAAWDLTKADLAERKSAKASRESEQRYRTLMEATAAIVWETSASGEFVEAQPQWTAFTGQTSEEAHGWGWLSAIHPQDREETGRLWLEALAGAAVFEIEHRLRAKDRAYRNMTVRAVPILAADGSIRQWIGVHTDVTERRREETELRWKSAFLEAQVNSSIDGILIVDQSGRKILQNERIAELLKIPRHIAESADDEMQLRWVASQVKYPAEFSLRVADLNEHPKEISRDEIELSDGTFLDRYSAPLTGKQGAYYGRVWTFRDVTDRRRTEESLRLFGSVVEQSTESIVITDAELSLPGPSILFVNPAFTAMTGYTAAEVLGQSPRILQGSGTSRAVLDRLRKNLSEGEVFRGEAINYRKDGTEFFLEWQVAAIRDRAGRSTHFVALQRDITGRKRFESQLFQSQKMETVGKLAAGVAHEFNSIMTAIIGQSELLLNDLEPASPFRYHAAEIHQAAGRAAVLTRQLLAFGRKQILKPEILDLNAILAGLEGHLRHLVGRASEIHLAPAGDLKTVKADAGQIEHVIIQLAMNAVDAMPNGGKLMLETANVTLDESYVARFSDLPAGEYVMLAITDTGAGMSEEVKARLFEPFFSTKPVGQGTGLGLSTCYGIVKQSGGHIGVYSEPTRGTSFKVYLPQSNRPANTPSAKLVAPKLPGGTETILLVEDDPSLREMATTLLERLGYTILAAANGVEALQLMGQHLAWQIDLLFTDMVMPQMDGQELAKQVLAHSAATRVLFTSAFTENAVIQQGGFAKGMGLLQKPFTPSALANRLREILDR